MKPDTPETLALWLLILGITVTLTVLLPIIFGAWKELAGNKLQPEIREPEFDKRERGAS